MLLVVLFVLGHAWVVIVNGLVIPHLAAAVTDSAAPGWVKGLAAIVFGVFLSLLAPVVVSGGSLKVDDSFLFTLALSLASSQALWDMLVKHKTGPALSKVFPLNIGKPAAPPAPEQKAA